MVISLVADVRVKRQLQFVMWSVSLTDQSKIFNNLIVQYHRQFIFL